MWTMGSRIGTSSKFGRCYRRAAGNVFWAHHPLNSFGQWYRGATRDALRSKVPEFLSRSARNPVILEIHTSFHETRLYVISQSPGGVHPISRFKQHALLGFVQGLSSIPDSSISHQDIPHVKENNVTYDDESIWLHMNEEYQMQQIGGRMRAIAMPHGHKIFRIERDVAQEPITQLSGFELPQLGTVVNQTNPDCALEDAGIQPFTGSNQPKNTSTNYKSREMKPSLTGGQTSQKLQLGNDQTDDPYGIFEPIVHQTTLEDCLGTVQRGEAADHEPDEEARMFTEQVILHEQHQYQILRSTYTETYLKSIMPEEKYRTADIVGHYDFHMRGLHFAAKKEKSQLLFQRFQKS